MDKGTKRNLFVAATYAVVLLVGILLGQNYGVENRVSSVSPPILPLSNQDKYDKVQRTLDLISGNYVDSVNMDSLQNKIIAEMVSKLDPHSDYLDPMEAAIRQQALEGSFEGIGVEYFLLNDTVLTVRVLPDGPASKAGVLVGDRVMAIGGTPVAGVNITNQDLEKLIKGRQGSIIELSVRRKGLDLPLPIKVTRDKFEISSIDASYLIDPTIAYVKISNFGSKTIDDCRKDIQNMEKQGARQVILDLRGNRGGYLSAGIDLAGLFLPEGQMVVYTEGVHENKTQYAGRQGGIFSTKGLAILIDEESASASEIVAGAIQDYERGIIIGRRSFGKGLIQERFGFGDGSLLNLTVARFYTPLGRSIQRVYEKDQYLKADSNKSYPLYRTASGKVLRGGGGIVPDIEIALDSTMFSKIYQQIYQQGLVHEYVYGRLGKGIPSFAIENFLNGYYLSEEEFASFVDFVESKGMVLSEEEESRIKTGMSTEMEALLGRYYFGSDAYFKVKNRKDPVVEVARNYFKTKDAQEATQIRESD